MRLKTSVKSPWQAAQKKLPVALNWLQRISGYLPPDGKAPLTEKEYAKVWDGPKHSISDYLPWVDFDDEHKVFQMNDGVSVGAAFELRQINIEGKSGEAAANSASDAAPSDKIRMFMLHHPAVARCPG